MGPSPCIYMSYWFIKMPFLLNILDPLMGHLPLLARYRNLSQQEIIHQINRSILKSDVKNVTNTDRLLIVHFICMREQYRKWVADFDWICLCLRMLQIISWWQPWHRLMYYMLSSGTFHTFGGSNLGRKAWRCLRRVLGCWKVWQYVQMSSRWFMGVWLRCAINGLKNPSLIL